jgi:hypothetical protein
MLFARGILDFHLTKILVIAVHLQMLYGIFILIYVILYVVHVHCIRRYLSRNFIDSPRTMQEKIVFAKSISVHRELMHYR